MELKNVDVTAKSNVYFNGKVSSRTVILPDQTRITLGFMSSGEYEFNTAAAEKMELLGGSMKVMVCGESEYKEYSEGESFSVPENSSFKAIVENYADYCCYYL